MRLSNYQFADYRLAAYVVIGAVIAGSVAFGLDRLTAPSAKVEANGAPPAQVAAASSAVAGNAASNAGANNVRQIPIARPNTADLGDPEGKLTPIYPAAPGKELPIKDTPIIQAKPAAPASTTGSASASPAAAPVAPAPAPVAAAPVAPAAAAPAAPAPVTTAAAPAANACPVAACAAAYRSFRESDCSYQPMVGARRTCEGAPGMGGPSSTGQVASQPQGQQQFQQQQTQQSRQIDPGSPAMARRSYDDQLRDVERTVRRLPPPGAFAGDDPRGVVVMEAPERRYELRRNWVSEPQDDD